MARSVLSVVNEQVRHQNFHGSQTWGPVQERDEDVAYACDDLIAVGDGWVAGDVAATPMINSLASAEMPHTDPVDALRAAVEGDEGIAACVARHSDDEGMGTTLTAVLIRGVRLGLLHGGDSHAYLFRQAGSSSLSHDRTAPDRIPARG